MAFDEENYSSYRINDFLSARTSSGGLVKPGRDFAAQRRVALSRCDATSPLNGALRHGATRNKMLFPATRHAGDAMATTMQVVHQGFASDGKLATN